MPFNSNEDESVETAEKKANIDSTLDDSSSSSESLLICTPSTSDQNYDQNYTEYLSGIEEKLEKSCENTNLTATNVKTILKNIITSEEFKEMMENVNLINDVEPKLTRSKVKKKEQESETLDFNSLFDIDDIDDDDDEYCPAEDGEEEEDETGEGSEMEEDDNTSEMSRSEAESEILNIEHENLIASRTRSKLQIDELPPETLVLPDATSDMYCNENDEIDDEWMQFLNSLYDDNKLNDEDMEEYNDPEYNVYQDIKDLDDEWDFRNDKAVKVSSKELNLLMDENQIDYPTKDLKSAIECGISKGKNDIFTSEMIHLLSQQMHQHVQLLSQNYLQTKSSRTLSEFAEKSKSMLEEISEKSSSKTNSLFKTNNLDCAMNLINQFTIKESPKKLKSYSWRLLPVPNEIRRIFVDNLKTVFLYPHLIPQCGYYEIDKQNNLKSKTFFTIGEDNLIALGLEQFHNLSNRKCYKYIKQLLLPVKTVNQIRTRIKNLKRRSNENEIEKNPIYFYHLNRKAPPTNSVIFNKLPEDIRLYPDWLQKALKPSKNNVTSLMLTPKGYCNTLSPIKSSKSLSTPKQSPLKQMNSIVKKYRQFHRFRPIKQKTEIVKENIFKIINENSGQIQTPKSTKIDLLPIESQNEFISNVEMVTDDQEKQKQIEFATTNSPISENEPIKEHLNVEDMNEEEFDDINLNKHTEENDLNENVLNDDEEFDDESDLAALMTASSTIAIKNKLKARISESSTSSVTASITKKEGRKSLAIKHKESTLQLLAHDLNQESDSDQPKGQTLINYYLERIKQTLKHEQFIQFLDLLSKLHEENFQQDSLQQNSLQQNSFYSTDAFNKIENFLENHNVDDELKDALVLFLNSTQARECGKMFEYLYWKRVLSFMKKLEIYFAGDQQGLQRIFRILKQLRQNEQTLNKSKIKVSMSKILNGHTYLMNELSSLFLDEKPNEYLLMNDEDFDEIKIDDKGDSDDFFENINIPVYSEELKYGTNECPCKMCHQTEKIAGKHCISCSIKFIGGRIYILQSNKKFHLAQVNFSDKSDPKFAQMNFSDKSGPKLSQVNFSDKSYSKNIQSDGSLDEENIQDDNNDEIESKTNLKDGKWTKEEDKVLLELCRSKVINDQKSTIGKEVFEEIAHKLIRKLNDVVARFNYLIEIFNQNSNNDIEDV